MCVCVSEGGARGRWKVLKVENRSGVEQTEELLQSLQDRILQLHSRRHRLSELIQDLRRKVRLRPFTLLLLQHPQCTASTLFPPQKQESLQLRDSFHKAQNALQSCDRQLGRLRVRAEEGRRKLVERQQLGDG